MSLLNIVLANASARVYVDTAAGGAASDGQVRVFELAKVLPLVVPNCVLAGRGNPAFLSILSTSLRIAAADDFDFDAIAASLPAMACNVNAQYAAAAADLSPATPAKDQEIALVGWSPSRSRMACMMCFVDVGAVGAECVELPAGGEWLTPWAEDWGTEPAAPGDDAAALVLASEQVRRGRVAWPSFNFGGRLLAATVTRDELRVREVGQL